MTDTHAWGIALCIGCKHTFPTANDDGKCGRNHHGDLKLEVACLRCGKVGCMWLWRAEGGLSKAVAATKAEAHSRNPRPVPVSVPEE